jgi:pimeloyl-ACP methyl ester carboxylesterase
MKKSLHLISLVLAALGLAAIAAIAFRSAYGGAGVSDPASARCDAPAPRFGRAIRHGAFSEATVRFSCSGAIIAGTLTLPPGRGPHGAVVFVHGSGPVRRYTYRAPFVRALVDAGVAVLSYDKRGVGESGGVCCPGDADHFNLLAADADGAVNALRTRRDIARDRIGLVGASQAGWIVPLAIARSRGHVAFSALVDAPAVSGGEERLYSRLAGEGDPASPPLTAARKGALEAELDRHGPSGFDPGSVLRRMTIPALWLYGGGDRSVPADRSARVLRSTNPRFSIVIFPGAGHGLLDVPPSDPRALPTLVAWVANRVR